MKEEDIHSLGAAGSDSRPRPVEVLAGLRLVSHEGPGWGRPDPRPGRSAGCRCRSASGSASPSGWSSRSFPSPDSPAAGSRATVADRTRFAMASRARSGSRSPPFCSHRRPGRSTRSPGRAVLAGNGASDRLRPKRARDLPLNRLRGLFCDHRGPSRGPRWLRRIRRRRGRPPACDRARTVLAGSGTVPPRVLAADAWPTGRTRTDESSRGPALFPT